MRTCSRSRTSLMLKSRRFHLARCILHVYCGVNVLIIIMVTLQGQPLYRVRWKGFDDSHDTWEPRENLLTCDAILDGFLKTRCRKSVRECIDFLQDENERKAKKTKAKVDKSRRCSCMTSD